MNENTMPIKIVFTAPDVSSSGSQFSNTNDVIDLTETNDCDESDVTSNSVIVSRNRRRKNINSSETLSGEDSSSTAQPDSKDDSICILYENIQPPPEVVVVNEIIIDASTRSESNDNSPSVRSPPTIMGAFNEYPEPVTEQIPPLFPELPSPYEPINYSFDVEIRVPPRATRSSCIYATTNERSHQVIEPYIRTTVFQGLSQIRPEGPMKAVTTGTYIPPSESSKTEEANKVTKVPKIECGICMDGPDELAASDRNFVSTNCGHVFCNDCIKTSMRSAAKCPKCRKKITTRSIHPLYL